MRFAQSTLQAALFTLSHAYTKLVVIQKVPKNKVRCTESVMIKDIVDKVRMVYGMFTHQSVQLMNDEQTEAYNSSAGELLGLMVLLEYTQDAATVLEGEAETLYSNSQLHDYWESAGTKEILEAVESGLSDVTGKIQKLHNEIRDALKGDNVTANATAN